MEIRDLALRAKKILNRAEQARFAPVLGKKRRSLTPKQLLAKKAAAKKQHEKYRDLAKRHKAMKKSTRFEEARARAQFFLELFRDIKDGIADTKRQGGRLELKRSRIVKALNPRRVKRPRLQALKAAIEEKKLRHDEHDKELAALPMKRARTEGRIQIRDNVGKLIRPKPLERMPSHQTSAHKRIQG